MITRLRRTTHEQRKLLFSLGTNFATRIPGAIGVLWFLPLLRFGLGTDDYSALLAAMALGASAAFLIGGFSTVGRRLIGEAYAAGNRSGEADGCVSTVLANGLALLIALAIILTYCAIRHASLDVVIISTLPAIGIFLTTFDNIRAAYNEHYVTALLQLVFQITIYTIGFLVPVTQHNLILASLILQGHYLISSLITLGLLMYKRPYLILGRPRVVWRVAKDGTLVAVADGFLTTTLSLSVVWLQASASANTSAWFATTVRLFQTFLVPVILLLMPLSSYIRILWNGKSQSQQQKYTKITLWIGVGYGVMVSVGLIVASRLYIEYLLHLPPPGSFLMTAPIFLLFGAIVAWKTYSSIAYLVLETSHLSTWTSISLAISVTLAIAVSKAVDPLNVINVYSFTAGVLILGVMFWNAGRFMRIPTLSPSSKAPQ